MQTAIEPAEPEHDTPQPDPAADMPEPMLHPASEVKVRYPRGLSPMQQTALLAAGTTPQEIGRAAQRPLVKRHAKDAKAKAKRKQQRASRARNRS